MRAGKRSTDWLKLRAMIAAISERLLKHEIILMMLLALRSIFFVETGSMRVEVQE